MMGLDPGVAVFGALCALAVPLLVLVAVYLGARTLGLGRQSPRIAPARVLLDRRLAEGVIDVEEYYERDSALRSTEPVAAKRR